MNTYLTIMVTILVTTQLIRIIQNAIQLHWQSKKINAQISSIQEITNHDIDVQKEAYRLIVKYLSDKVGANSKE